MTDRVEVARLTLRLERAVAARRHLRELVAAANDTVADARQELWNLKARVVRRAPVLGPTE